MRSQKPFASFMINIKLAPIENSIVNLLQESATTLDAKEIASQIQHVRIRDWDGWNKILDRLAYCGFIRKVGEEYGAKK